MSRAHFQEFLSSGWAITDVTKQASTVEESLSKRDDRSPRFQLSSTLSSGITRERSHEGHVFHSEIQRASGTCETLLHEACAALFGAAFRVVLLLELVLEALLVPLSTRLLALLVRGPVGLARLVRVDGDLVALLARFEQDLRELLAWATEGASLDGPSTLESL